MNMRVIEVLTALALTIAAILSFAKGAHANDIMVMNPVAAKSLTASARTGAVYLSIMNHGAGPDTLLGIATPAAEFAELHETTNADGIAKMRKVDALEIAPMQTVDLLPGSMHIMLTGLKKPLTEGASLELTLTFAKAGTVNVTAKVGDVKIGDHDMEKMQD